MPFDENLAGRVREILGEREGLSEKKMFGGLAFMLNGNMCVGVEKDRLMVRLGTDRYHEALSRPHAAPMDFTGRPMKGFVFVFSQGVATESELKEWVDLGIEFCRTLPAKTPKARKS